MTTEVGVVTLNYKQNGELAGAVFVPTMQLNANAEFLKGLNSVKSSDNPGLIKAHAQRVFAGWFSQMTRIELDESYQLTSRVDLDTCERFTDGTVKTCRIIFSINQ